MHIDTANEAQWLITFKTGVYTLKAQNSNGRWYIQLPNDSGQLHTLEGVFDWLHVLLNLPLSARRSLIGRLEEVR